MHEHSKETLSSTHTITKRRYWLRKDKPQMGWWPWGLLPLLGLLFLYLWGAFNSAPKIETDVQDSVRKTLSAESINLLDVKAAGQGVLVKAIGNGTDVNDQVSEIKLLAKNTACNTWAGLKKCPTNIDVKLEQVSQKPPTISEPQKLNARFHNFEFIQNGTAITLAGEVPNENTRQELLNFADKNYAEIVDKLVISKELNKPNFRNSYTKALDVLKWLESGKATRTNGVLTISGLVNADKEKLVRSLFAANPNATTLGKISLDLVKGVDTCNTEFKNLLETSTINFRTGSAEIDTSSRPLLTTLARLAKECPGILMVEGHTDNRGSAEFNQTLSQQRASSIRDALISLGIKAERLQAKGYGLEKPIADNATSVGRAKNRRIVIRIAQ